MTAINRDWDLFHPKARQAFRSLAQDLEFAYEAGETETLFKLFEGYRSPERQHHLLTTTTSTKAGPWQSFHQYGLAADFVPCNPKIGWSWDGHHDWEFLRQAAEHNGLRRPLSWDLAHIEHPLCDALRRVLF